jgi:hypothetical protein
MVLSLLFIWSQGTLAEDYHDYVSTFDMPHHGKESSYFFNKPVPYIPRSDEAQYTERSFSDLTKSSSGIPSVIDRTAFTIAFDISNSQSSNNQRTQESQTSFREIQNSLPIRDPLDGHKGRLRASIYAHYVSSASENETWLMILVGVTLMGLQVIRSNKKAEPIYSSFN